VAILFSMKKFNNLGKGMNVVVLPLDEHELAILAPCNCVPTGSENVAVA